MQDQRNWPSVATNLRDNILLYTWIIICILLYMDNNNIVGHIIKYYGIFNLLSDPAFCSVFLCKKATHISVLLHSHLTIRADTFTLIQPHT